MRFFIKLGTDNDTPEEPETPDTPPTENAPLHRGAATEIEEIHQYIYAGGKLLRETISDGTTTKTLDFNYDNVGMPYSLIYNNGTTTTTYYYITNLQGDVMYLADASGVQVAAYDYDPYGKIISATGDLAEVNPLRYRGYYYDAETGFYYLQSRYYDPKICRFINADSYASTGQGFTGLNMFAYCNNSPSSASDPSGEFPWITGLIGAAVGAIVGVASAAITGGDGWDILIAGISSATAGFVIGATGSTTAGSIAGRAVGSTIVAAGTYISARRNGVNPGAAAGCAVLSGSVSFATASLSASLGAGQVVAGAVVDSTFGFGGSLSTSAISSGIARNSSRQSKDPQKQNQRITAARKATYKRTFTVSTRIIQERL